MSLKLKQIIVILIAVAAVEGVVYFFWLKKNHPEFFSTPSPQSQQNAPKADDNLDSALKDLDIVVK